MGKDKSSDKEVMAQRGDEEPQIAEFICKSSCKRTDVPHYVESMNEGNKRSPSSGHFLHLRHYSSIGAIGLLATGCSMCILECRERNRK
jgi:hypothetical protein